MAVWTWLLELDSTVQDGCDITVCFRYFDDETVCGTCVDGEMGAVGCIAKGCRNGRCPKGQKAQKEIQQHLW